MTAITDTAPALLVLEDGTVFRGRAYGAVGETFGEAVFTTGMSGYQETLTDPSYHRQVVVQTAPHIGNYGVNDDDAESRRIWVAGYVVRDPSRISSNWRAQRTLDHDLVAQGIVGICDVDTRAITRHLRERGAMRVGVFSGEGLSSRIMLGTDGMHSDMLKSAQAAYFNGIDPERVGLADVYSRLRRVHDYLQENGFAGDGENNLVVLDYPSPTPVSEENFLAHFFYGLGSRHVDSVIARGKLIVENRRITTVDEEEVLALTRAGAEKLWRRLAQ